MTARILSFAAAVARRDELRQRIEAGITTVAGLMGMTRERIAADHARLVAWGRKPEVAIEFLEEIATLLTSAPAVAV